MSPTIKIKRIDPNLPLPKYETGGAVGFDLYSMIPFRILKNEIHIVSTGIKVEIPIGFEGQIRPRSGLAAKQGIIVVNSPGTIDCDYRGEIKVILSKIKYSVTQIGRGDRIAQMVITPVIQASIEEVEELTETGRGEGGLGSTGE